MVTHKCHLEKNFNRQTDIYIYIYIYIIMHWPPLESCIVICWFMQKYTYIYWIHTNAMITDAKTTTHEGRMKDKDAGRLLQQYFTSHFIARVRNGSKGLHVRGSWRSNINCNILTPLLWAPRCVFLVFLMLGSTPSRFPRAPSVGCGPPHHIWSPAVWNSTGNCFLDSNSTELNNNSTPTRSPTGSLKSNV